MLLSIVIPMHIPRQLSVGPKLKVKHKNIHFLICLILQIFCILFVIYLNMKKIFSNKKIPKFSNTITIKNKSILTLVLIRKEERHWKGKESPYYADLKHKNEIEIRDIALK